MKEDIIIFENSDGSSIPKNFWKVFSFFVGVSLIIILLGSIKSWDKVDFIFSAMVTTIGLVFAFLMAIKAVYRDFTRIEFGTEGIHLSSPLYIKRRIGRYKFIPYQSCNVREWHYWKLTVFYSLQIRNNRKHVCNILEASWKESYTAIKRGLTKRLESTQYSFEKWH